MRAMKERKLQLLLQAFQKTGVDELTLAEMVMLTRTIAEAYLSSHRCSLVLLCQQNGLTINDLAFTCIERIFFPVEGRFSCIENFIASLHQPLEHISDHDVSAAYTAFVRTIVDLEINTQYAQWDATGSRILRNIKQHVKRGKQFSLQKDFRGALLVPRRIASLEHLPAFPERLLREQLSPCVQQDIPHVLTTLWHALASQTTYRRQIVLTDLLLAIKDLVSDTYEYTKEDIPLSSYEPDLEQQINRLLPIGMEAAERAIVRYYRRQQITQMEAGVLLKTVGLSLQKELMGNGKTTLFDHLAEVHSVTQQEYKTRWQQKLEYSVRAAKDAIHEVLTTDL
jgi:hypothetical protein